MVGAAVRVTDDAGEVAAELRVDPDEARHTAEHQHRCGARGTIRSRSEYGWLRVGFDDGSPSMWFTPFCLWLLPTDDPAPRI